MRIQIAGSWRDSQLDSPWPCAVHQQTNHRNFQRIHRWWNIPRRLEAIECCPDPEIESTEDNRRWSASHIFDSNPRKAPGMVCRTTASVMCFWQTRQTTVRSTQRTVDYARAHRHSPQMECRPRWWILCACGFCRLREGVWSCRSFHFARQTDFTRRSGLHHQVDVLFLWSPVLLTSDSSAWRLETYFRAGCCWMEAWLKVPGWALWLLSFWSMDLSWIVLCINSSMTPRLQKF